MNKKKINLEFFYWLMSKLKNGCFNIYFFFKYYIYPSMIWVCTWIGRILDLIIYYGNPILFKIGTCHKYIRICLCFMTYAITVVDSISCYFWFNRDYGFTGCTMLVIDLYALVLFCLCIIAIENDDYMGFFILSLIMLLSSFYLFYIMYPIAMSYISFKFICFLVTSCFLYYTFFYFLD